jgi:hypothetical protein
MREGANLHVRPYEVVTSLLETTLLFFAESPLREAERQLPILQPYPSAPARENVAWVTEALLGHG